MSNYTYKHTIDQLIKNPTAFLAFVSNLAASPPANPRQLLYLVKKMPANLQQDPKIQAELLNQAKSQVDKVLRTKKKWGSHGKELGTMLKTFKDGFDASEQRKIMLKVMPNLASFYPYGKKEVLDVFADWVESEDIALQIVTKHHRMLTPDQLERTISKISKGWDHDSVKAAFANSISAMVRKFKDANLKDPDVRKDFINAIAMRPSLITKINKRVRLTLSDLNSLPPARRFNFLQELYAPIFRYYNLNTISGIVRAFETSPRNSVVSIEPVPAEEMETLLFSLSIRKNDEVAKWFEQYKKFLINRDKLKKNLDSILRWL